MDVVQIITTAIVGLGAAVVSAYFTHRFHERTAEKDRKFQEQAADRARDERRDMREEDRSERERQRGEDREQMRDQRMQDHGLRAINAFLRAAGSLQINSTTGLASPDSLRPSALDLTVERNAIAIYFPGIVTENANAVRTATIEMFNPDVLSDLDRLDIATKDLNLSIRNFAQAVHSHLGFEVAVPESGETATASRERGDVLTQEDEGQRD